MDKNSNGFVLAFAIGVCVVMATGLAATHAGLKPTMDANQEFDRHRNVLLAMGLVDKRDVTKSRQEIEQLFEKRVEGKVLEVIHGIKQEKVMENGKPVTKPTEAVVELKETEHQPEELPQLRLEESRKPKKERREFVPLFVARGPDGHPQAYAIPISGYGLWSTIYGYLALEQDLNTVKGITFYKHGETPGLGGEVENVAWQESWEGKHILDNGKLVSIKLKKGHVDPTVEFEKEHMVDGLSGATLTSNGVNRFVASDLRTYEPYFEKLRNRDQ